MSATRSLISRALGFLLVAFALAGCGRESPATQAAAPSPFLSVVPVEMTVPQRSTTEAPGSDGRLLLTINDITRGQVMVSLAMKDGTLLLPTRPMSPGDSAPFDAGEARYVLLLKELDNAAMGDDLGTFVISSAAEDQDAVSEQEKIERLIQTIAELQDAIFIRNGAEHSAQDAADHLQRKWRARADQINTAEQFIDALATRSSMSGQPYHIRLSDGRMVSSGDYLHERLREIEQESLETHPPGAFLPNPDTIAVAEAAGVDYAAVVDGCLRRDRRAMHTLFWLTANAGFDAASAEGNAAVLGLLLRHMGDDCFGSALARESDTTQQDVRDALYFDFGVEPGDEEAGIERWYPVTFNLVVSASSR